MKKRGFCKGFWKYNEWASVLPILVSQASAKRTEKLDLGNDKDPLASKSMVS
jgi:hypothetical protein